MNQGWVGRWSPGIGDPTIGGWVSVALYAGVAWACHRILSRRRQRPVVLDRNEPFLWRLLFIGVMTMGINKQLDLQSALSEWARLMAHEQGWYENRRQYQLAFIAAMPVAMLTAFSALALMIWRTPAPTLLACAGAAGLVAFIAIRAASFHHVDEILNSQLGVLRLNWLLEIGSLAVIGLGALKRVKVGT